MPDQISFHNYSNDNLLEHFECNADTCHENISIWVDKWFLDCDKWSVMSFGCYSNEIRTSQQNQFISAKITMGSSN